MTAGPNSAQGFQPSLVMVKILLLSVFFYSDNPLHRDRNTAQVLAVGIASITMLSTGLFFHMVSIFTDSGLTPSIAASVFLPIAATTAIVNFGSGILVDRIPPRFLLATALFLQAISLLMAKSLSGVQLAFLYGIILGTTMGLTVMVNSVSWAMYFGRQHLGSIR